MLGFRQLRKVVALALTVFLIQCSGRSSTDGQPSSDKSGSSERAAATSGGSTEEGVPDSEPKYERRRQTLSGTLDFSESSLSSRTDDSLDIASGDLDHDGTPELVVANFGSANTVWARDSSGSFNKSDQFGGAGDTTAVQLGDFNNDSNLDVFVTNDGADNEVWLGQGDGTFGSAPAATIGKSTNNKRSRDVDLGDINGDGLLDAYVANFRDRNYGWLNQGSGGGGLSFSSIGFSCTNCESDGVELGDLDEDGYLDVFVANRSDDSNGVWLYDPGNETFNSATNVGTNSSRDVALGDIDEDGDLDAFVANEPGNSNDKSQLWLNDLENGNGFQNVASTDDSIPSRDAEMLDIDLDGQLEILNVNGDSNEETRIWEYDISSNTLGLSGSSTGLGPAEREGLTTPDLDGDGDRELAMALPNAKNEIWINTLNPGLGDRTFGCTGYDLGSASSTTTAVALADLDRDGDLDAFTTNDGSGNGAANVVWFNELDESSETFAKDPASGSNTSRDVAIGDLDRDSYSDVFVANYGEANTVWISNGSSSATTSSVGTGSNSTAVAMGDFFNNGSLDVFVANDSSGPLNQVFKNNGDGTFGTPIDVSLKANDSQGAALGDLDLDGKLDVFVANDPIKDDNKTWLNLGAGDFTGQVVSASPAFISVDSNLVDVDTDGDLDAVFGNRNDDNRIWLNDGSGAFSFDSQYVGSTGDTVAIDFGDIDQDGDPDAVVGNEGAGESQFWLNKFDTSTPQFDFKQQLGSWDTRDVALGDLTGDGDLDAFIANYGSPNKLCLLTHPPSAGITTSPIEDPPVENTVSLDGGSSGDDNHIDAYEWIVFDPSGSQATTGSGETSDFYGAKPGFWEVQLTVTDNAGVTDEHTRFVEVNGPPNASDDPNLSVSEDSTKQFTVVGNDSDPNGDNIGIFAVDPDTGVEGEVNIAGTNRNNLEFFAAGHYDSLPAGQSDSEDIVYQVEDEHGLSGLGSDQETSDAVATVEVIGKNDPPDAAGEVFSTEDSNTVTNSTTSSLLDNTTPIDDSSTTLFVYSAAGDTANVTGSGNQGKRISSATGSGEFVIYEDGSWLFDPTDDFLALDTGEDSASHPDFTNPYVTYRVADDSGDSTGRSGRVNLEIQVTGQNDPPVVENDAATVSEGNKAAIPVLENDDDPDDGLSIGGLSNAPNKGAISTTGTGEVEFDTAGDFDPLGPSSTDTVSFDYTATDGDVSDTGSVAVTVEGVNDAPKLDAISNFTIQEDAGKQSVSLSGIGAGGGESQSLEVTATSSNTSVIPSPNVTYSSPDSTGTIFFEPEPDEHGTATIEVTVDDGKAKNNAVHRVFDVTVEAVNDTPVANDDGPFTTDEDTSLTISASDIRSNDSDVEDATSNLTLSVLNQPSHGSVSKGSNGGFVYTPDPDFYGQDAFEYALEDSGGKSASATVSLEVSSVEDAPEAVAKVQSTSNTLPNPGKTLTLDGTGSSDGDANSQLSYSWSVAQAPSANSATLASPNSASTDFTPTVGGDYQFELVVSDQTGRNDTASLSVTVNHMPEASVSQKEYDGRALDSELTLDATSSSDPNDQQLSYAWTVTPLGGLGSASYSISGADTPQPTFTPAKRGRFELELTITDPHGMADAVTVSVETNRPPSASISQSRYTGEIGDSIALDGSGTSDAKHQTSALDFAWSISPKGGLGSQSYTLNGADTAKPTFTANKGGTFGVTLEVTDPDGASDTASATIDINRPPTAAVANDSHTVQAGSSVQLDASGSSDAEDGAAALTFSWSVSAPGTVSEQDYSLSGRDSATPRFTPQVAGTYTLEVTVSDTDGGQATATTSVTATNNEPAAEVGQSSYDINRGETITLDASGSTDTEDDPGELGFSWAVTPPAGAGSGSYTLSGETTPTPQFSPQSAGIFGLTVTVTDTNGGSDTASISVSVNGGPSASLTAEPPVVNPGETVELNAGRSTDPDGDGLQFSWTALSQPSTGSIRLGSKSGETVSVSPNEPGDYRVEVTVSDGRLSASRSTGFSVNGAPEPSISVSPEVVAPGQTVSVTSNTRDDGFGSGDVDLTWRLTSVPQNSQAALASTSGGETSIEPDKAGNYTVELEATDPMGLAATATATLTVNAPPEADAEASPKVVAVGETGTLDASSSSDSDDPNDQLSYDWEFVDKPEGSGAVPFDSQGAQTDWRPDVRGQYKAQVTVTDPAGYSDSATILLEGNAAPQAVIARQSVKINPGQQLQLDATGSTDPETASGDLEFSWATTQSPQGASEPTLSDSPTPTVRLSVPGLYEFELTVEDAAGLTDTTTMEATVRAKPGFAGPTPTEPVVATSGERVVFDVRAEDENGNEVEVELASGPDGAQFEDGTLIWDTTLPETGTEDFVFEAKNGEATATHTVQVKVDKNRHKPCGKFDCGDSEVCQEGLCFNSCSGDAECEADGASCFGQSRCAESACSRISCGEGKTCHQGTCFPDCENSCPGPQRTCIDGRCATGECSGVQCSAGDTCDEGQCVARSELEESENDEAEDEGDEGAYESSEVGDSKEESRDAELKDLDGDGDPDLVVANNPSPNTIWENKGDGQFEKVFETPAANATRGVALGDLNGDNRIDVFAANRGGANVVWEGNGDLSFEKGAEMSLENESEGVALGDLNGDNRLDAYVANDEGQNNVIWQNDGSGNFTKAGETEFGRDSSDVALGDLNGDNRIDIFVANESGGSVLWENDGSLQFQVGFETPEGSSSEGIALGDLNGDNRIDAFIANGDGQPDTVWENNGGLSFDEAFSTSISRDSSDVALGDLNGDNRIDGVVASRDSEQMVVFKNDGAFSFDRQIKMSGARFSESVDIADVNGDESPDMFVAKKGENNELMMSSSGSPDSENGGGSSGCSCSTTESGPDTPLGVLLVALGLGWAVRRRRRR